MGSTRHPLLTALLALLVAPGLAHAGTYHTCVTHRDGHVQCWGSNNSGELGDGSTTSRTLPGAFLAR